MAAAGEDVREIHGHAARQRGTKQFHGGWSRNTATVDDKCSFRDLRTKLEATGPDQIDDSWRLWSHASILQVKKLWARSRDAGVIAQVSREQRSVRPFARAFWE